MKFYADLYDRLKAAAGSPVDNAQVNSGPRVMTLGAALEEGFKDSYSRKRFTENVLEPVLTKIVKTPDIQNLRMASVSDMMAMNRNEDTPWLNYLESNGVARSLDYQYAWNEYNIGTDEAEIWDVQEDLPGEAKSNRPRRTNTITAFGNTMRFSDLVLDMARQQANVDLIAEEVSNEVIRIRRKMNSVLLSNTEVKFETAGSPNFPQMGGFITRSTANNADLAGGDFTRTVLQGMIDSIADNGDPEGRGYGKQLVLFTNAKQLQVIRDIMISEYNGVYWQDRVAFESALMGRMRDFRVPVQTVFEALPGRPVPAILDSQIPSGFSFMCEDGLAKLVKMYLGGVPGPYVLTRPTEKLQRLDVMFDLVSLSDPLQNSRSVRTSVGV